MRRTTIIIVTIFLISVQIWGQDSTRVSESTTEENIALITMTGILIPLALIGTIVSALPPSFSMVSVAGGTYGALNIESGIGLGEWRETGIFSDWRLGVSYSYIIHSNIRDVFRMELKRDVHFDFIDRRKIYLSGIHFSAGLLTDFPNKGFTIGSGAWVKSPWLSYFGFIPQHTFGITYRFNKYFGGKEFHEVSIGITSAFTL